MIFTFFVTMLMCTNILIALCALGHWNQKTHLPILIYVISGLWQIAFLLISVVPVVPEIYELYVYNFSYDEFVLMAMNMVLGATTSILIFIDFSWYVNMVRGIDNIKLTWRETFPTKDSNDMEEYHTQSVPTNTKSSYHNPLK